MGGPDGGSGGRGGHVFLEGDENVSDLTVYRARPVRGARGGGGGSGGNRNGARGEDLVLRLPLGTVVRGAETGKVVCELLGDKERVLLLRGGDGGMGNVCFKSSINRAPRRFTEGFPLEAGSFLLELKSMADVGLVGFPNAGKSSLMGVLTAGRPKVGAYPFTTLSPNVGVLEDGEGSRRLRLADIPGLVVGSHENKGLGYRFLRHVERCGLLVLVVDAAGSDGRDAAEDLKNLLELLECYGACLREKVGLVVGNKMDLPEASLGALRAAWGGDVLGISCLERVGMGRLRQFLFEAVGAGRWGP